ncbi:hypothetical protein TrST_g13132 [Triparma strigata]|uniref:BPM/SPOP BACK domain-containing protein n=1 Tax=Triparma strigata TaxID=1606541 RepID=A0A9W7F0Q9_9STRA|nr:hypothetical protein TrST_g13132 [Triparma strigata]
MDNSSLHFASSTSTTSSTSSSSSSSSSSSTSSDTSIPPSMPPSLPPSSPPYAPPAPSSTYIWPLKNPHTLNSPTPSPTFTLSTHTFNLIYYPPTSSQPSPKVYVFLLSPPAPLKLTLTLIHKNLTRKIFSQITGNLLTSSSLKMYGYGDTLPPLTSGYFWNSGLRLSLSITPPLTSLVPPSLCTRDYLKIFSSQTSTDYYLKCVDYTWGCHSIILKFRLKGYEFEGEGVEVEGVGKEGGRVFLEWVYGGRWGGEEWRGVYECARKFGVEDLRWEVTSFIMKDLNVDNAADVLVWAEKKSEVQVKERCLEFISCNSSKVMEGLGWRKLVEEKPDLVAELFANATGARKRMRSNDNL